MASSRPLLVSLLVSLLAAAGVRTQDPAGNPPPPVVPGTQAVPGDGGAGVDKNRPVPPGSWFKRVHHDFGTHIERGGEQLLEADYEFSNESGATQQIKSLVPSCKCQRLRLFVNDVEKVLERKADASGGLVSPVEVPAGAKGKLVMKFDVAGIAGVRTGDVRVETTDPAMPSILLSCEAKITPAFQVEPAAIDLGRMAPTDQKTWACKVRCLVRTDWKVKQALEPMPGGLRITTTEEKHDDKGTYYEISGTYGPELDEGASGGMVIFSTDDPKQNFQIQILAQVVVRVKLNPYLVQLGNFDRTQGAEQIVHVWPSDFTADTLTIDHVELVSCTVPKEFLDLEVVPPAAADAAASLVPVAGVEGGVPAQKLWQIRVHAKPGVTGRMMRFFAKVYFKEEGTVPKEFRGNGFPRDPRED